MGSLQSISVSRSTAISTFLFLLLISIPISAYPIEINSVGYLSAIDAVSPDQALTSPAVTTSITESASSIQYSATVERLNHSITDKGEIWRLPGEAIAGIEGMPDLPAISRWVVVPARGDVELHYAVQNQIRQQGSAPVVFHKNDEGEDAENTLIRNIPGGIWPSEVARISEPVVWRGVRMVNLTIHPVQWDATTREYIINEGIETELTNSARPGLNEVEPGYREPCRDFDMALRALVVNPPARDDSDEAYPPASYLIVANENYPEAVNELIEWKRQSGHRVMVETFDPNVMPRLQLKGRISNKYHEEGFSYLILIGNEEVDPPLEIPYDPEFYDNYFGQIDGNDVIADVAVGTYNCLTEDNLTCAIRRTIAYEKHPDNENADWFTKAFVGVGHCSVPDDLSPSYSGQWVQAVLERKGYEVASTYYADNEDNDFSPDVAEQYNDGVNMIIVRGHQSDFQQQMIERRGVYPFHFMVSSSTIAPGNAGSFNRTFRVGTPQDMRGPSAGFGHNPSPRTNIANAIVGGLAEALYHKGIRSFGWARNYTTAKIAVVMPADQGQSVTRYWGTWRYYGDPGQEPWIGVPREVEVEYDAFLIGQSGFRVRIHRGEEAVEGAVVTLYEPDGIHLTRISNSEGIVDFTWDNPNFDRNVPVLTVTGEGIYPWQDNLDPIGALDIVVTNFAFFDATHNQAQINPGDRIGFSAVFQNRGFPQGSEPFDINLLLNSSFVEGEFQAARVPAIAVNASVEVDFVPDNRNPPTLLQTTPDGVRIDAIIPIETPKGVYFDVAAPDLVVDNIQFTIEPDEERQLTAFVTLDNIGGEPARQVRGTLSEVQDNVDILNGDCTWEDIFIGNPVEPDEGLRFNVKESVLPGSTVELLLTIETASRVGIVLPISVEVGAAVPSDPTGSDMYGYIGLENGDDDVFWADAPDYNWINISPWGGDFEGELLNFPVQGEEDLTQVIDLPFTFRYYGREFDRISICNNGWIALGEQPELKNQQNWPMPGYNGAWGMIAPFWDRLFMNTRSDGVFYYFDEEEHKVIIQWQTGTKDERRDWFPNAFEVILFDPIYHATVTGDSPILFQYQTVNNVQDDFEANFGCTVGISSPDGEDGITYSYWGEAFPGSRLLAANRAILWTTTTFEPLATLTGRVVRYIDSTAVSGAWVSLSNNFQSHTNDEGIYRIVSLEGNDLTVSVTAESYGEAILENLELREGEIVEQDFVLPHGWLMPSEDTVRLHPLWDGPIAWTTGGVSFSNSGNRAISVTASIIGPDSGGWSDDIDLEIDPDTLVIGVAEEGGFDISGTGPELGHFEAIFRIIIDTPQESMNFPLIIDFSDEVLDDSAIPTDYSLSAPYPNPFNSKTALRFALPKQSDVVLRVVDLSGREVSRIVEGSYLAGEHRINFEAGSLTTGLYFVQMDAGGFHATERLLLIR